MGKSHKGEVDIFYMGVSRKIKCRYSSKKQVGFEKKRVTVKVKCVIWQDLFQKDSPKGVDYNGTFSAVLRYFPLRLLLALSAQYNLKINHLDVPTAFLNGHLDKCVYMEISEMSDFNDCANKVLKLNRSI